MQPSSTVHDSSLPMQALNIDFFRPIRTAEAFEAIPWLHQRTWPLVE